MKTKEEALEVIEKAEQKLSIIRSRASSFPNSKETFEKEFAEIAEREGWTEEDCNQIIDKLIEAQEILIPDSEDWKRLQLVGSKMVAFRRVLNRTIKP